MSTDPSPYSLDDFFDILVGYETARELNDSKSKFQVRSIMKEYFRAVRTVALKNRLNLPIMHIDCSNPQNVKEMIASFIQPTRLKEFSYFKPNDHFVVKVVIETSAEELLLRVISELEGFEPGIAWNSDGEDCLTYFFAELNSEIDLSKKGLIIDTKFRKEKVVDKNLVVKQCSDCKGWPGKCMFGNEVEHALTREDDLFYNDSYVVLCQDRQCGMKAGYIYISPDDNWYMKASEESGACFCEKKLKVKYFD